MTDGKQMDTMLISGEAKIKEILKFLVYLNKNLHMPIYYVSLRMN